MKPLESRPRNASSRSRFQGLGLGLAWAAMLIFAGTAEALTPVQKYGQLRVQGNKVVDQRGNPVVLNGMAFFWSQWMGKYYNADCVNWLAGDWKATVVRASMAVDDGGYATKRSEAAKVRAVVDAAIKAGIYVVIDFHVHEGQNHTELAKSFFTEMATAYGNHPNVIYEPWNEPLNTHAWAATIKPYHEAVIQAIRAVDPDNLILCGSKSWSQDVDEAAANPIKTSANIFYTLHYYAGTHRQSLRDKALRALNAGVALMVTEGGLSEASGGGNIDTAEARRWQNFMTEHKISWMNWSVADKEESSASLRPGAAAAGNWAAGQLTPSGAWTRNNLRQLWDRYEKDNIGIAILRKPDGRLDLMRVAGLPGNGSDALGRSAAGAGWEAAMLRLYSTPEDAGPGAGRSRSGLPRKSDIR